MSDLDLRAVRCRNCGCYLERCNDMGCGGRQKKNWRVELIAAHLRKVPKTAKKERDLLTLIVNKKMAEKNVQHTQRPTEQT